MEAEGNKIYIRLSEAEKLCPYSQEYLGLRARQGRLKAIKIGRNWMTTADWLREYILHCEDYYDDLSKKTKIKPESALTAEKITQKAPQKIREEAFKPEIIPNFWILLFNRAKLSFMPDATPHLHAKEGLARIAEWRLFQEIKLAFNSFSELLGFINVWIENEQPRLKLRTAFAGLAVILAVCGFLTLVTNAKVKNGIGQGALAILEYSAGFPEKMANSLLAIGDKTDEYAGELGRLSPFGRSFIGVGKSKVIGGLKNANEKLPKIAGDFGIMLEQKTGNANEWPRLALVLAKNGQKQIGKKFTEAKVFLTDVFEKNWQGFAIASRLSLQEADGRFQKAGRAINGVLKIALNNLQNQNQGFAENIFLSGKKFFAGIGNFSAGIENKILAGRNLFVANVSEFSAGILDTMSTLASKSVPSKISQAIKNIGDWLFGPAPSPQNDWLIVRMGGVPEPPEAEPAPTQPAPSAPVKEITKQVYTETKITEVTKITETINLVDYLNDLNNLELRLLGVLAENKSYIMQNLTHMTGYVSMLPGTTAPQPIQRFDSLTDITFTGSITQTGSEQVLFAGNVDASTGLDVTGGSLTVGGTAFIVDQSGNVFFAGDLSGTGGLLFDGNAYFAGTLGVGTSSPIAKLAVQSSDAAIPSFVIWGASGQTAPFFTIYNSFGSQIYTLSAQGHSTSTGQAIFTYSPTTAGENNTNDASIYINAASPVPDANLIAAASNNAWKFRVDAEGDVFIKGNLTTDGVVQQATTEVTGNLIVEGNSFLGDAPNNDYLVFSGHTRIFATSTNPTLSIYQGSTGKIFSAFDDATEVFTILDGGNVGIGTTSPYAKLSVVGPVVAEYFYATSSTATSTFLGGLSVAGSLGLNVLQNGKVGVGSTSPAGMLSVFSDGTSANIFEARASNNALRFALDYTGAAIFYNSSYFAADLRINDNYKIRFGSDYDYSFGYNSADDTFRIGDGDSLTAAPRLTLNSSGFFGIGTTTPRSLLQIAGTQPQLTFSDTSAGVDAKHWWLKSSNGDFSIGTTSDSLSSNTTYLTIASSTGNVGIGTANPNYKLSVSASVSPVIQFLQGASSASYIGINSGGNYVLQGGNYYGTGPQNIQFQSSYSDVLFNVNMNGNVYMGTAQTTSWGRFGIGTTTPAWRLQVASSSPMGATMALSDMSAGTDAKHWFISSTGGNFYIGTSSDALTSTATYLTFNTGNNVFLGYGSGSSNASNGLSNIAIGYQALRGNTTGDYNAAIGYQAQYTDTAGSYNTAIGYQALYTNDGYGYNTAIGYQALRANNRSYNTAIGFSALGANTYGLENTGVGAGVLSANTTGNSNTALGVNAGYGAPSVMTGNSNVFVGSYAGYNNLTGNANTYLGYYVNTFVGSVSSSTALGAGATITTSNQFVLGSTTAPIYYSYWGQGASSTAPSSFSFNATAGDGTDISGGNLIFNGGQSTGSGIGGNLIFQTSAAGGSGATLNSLTERMRIDSVGNVGIGTTTPADILNIASTLPRMYLSDTNFATNGHWFLENNAGVFSLGTTSSALAVSDTRAMTILNNGNVGIGTTTPRSLLTIAGTRPELTLTDTSTYNSHWFLSSQGGNLYVGTSSDALTATSTYLTINSAGNVGIGTNNPGTALDVLGKMQVLTYISSGWILLNGNAAGIGGSISNPWIAYAGSSGFWFSNSSPGDVAYRNTAGKLLFGTNDGPATMAISNSNVGIGTTTPYAMLSVAGQVVGAYFTATTTTASTFPYASTTAITSTGSAYFATAVGNVGIGTTTPRSLLQIAGTRPQLTLTDTSTYNSHWFLSSQGGNLYVGTSSDALSATTTSLIINNSLANVYIGYQSGRVNTSGNKNTTLGFMAGASIDTGYRNVYIGNNAGMTATAYFDNTFVGESAGKVTASNYSTFIGAQSGLVNTSGVNNAFLGAYSGYNNTTGGYNVFLGGSAGLVNATGMLNTYIGYFAGFGAGYFYRLDANSFLGAYTGVSTNQMIMSSSTAIGYGATITGSNQLVIGSTTAPIYNAFFGTGATSTATSYFRINATGGLGTNIAGSNLNLAGGRSTGSASGGAIIFETSGVGVSSDVLNSLSERMRINSSGNVGIGTTSPSHALVLGSGSATYSMQIPLGGLCVDSDGWCNASTTGRVSATSYTTGSSDIAENYYSDENLEPGEIVYAKSANIVGKAGKENGQIIIGAVSSKPGVILGFDNDNVQNNQHPIALAGRVPVKVNLEGGEIKIGDRIVLSSIPGIGAKATTSGMTIGIALEAFDGSQNIGADKIHPTPPFLKEGDGDKILVFINLSWYAGPLAQDGSFGQSQASQTENSLFDFKAGLESLGLLIENGVARLQKLVADSVVTKHLQIGSSENPNGFTIFDQDTGQPFCLKVKSGQIVSEPGECLDFVLTLPEVSAPQEQINALPEPEPIVGEETGEIGETGVIGAAEGTEGGE